MERSQFSLQMERHSAMMRSLSLTGLAHNVGVLGSASKTKSGVLSVLQLGSGRCSWAQHFFVLSHHTLYYFEHDPDAEITRSSTPKSFIALRFAAVELDAARIKGDRFVVRITTPLRCVHLRCRHPLALAEWVAALKGDQCDADEKSSDAVLAQIRRMRSRVATLQRLLRHQRGVDAFDAFLRNNGAKHALLRCWLALLHYRRDDAQLSEAQVIWSTFLDDAAEGNIWGALDAGDWDANEALLCECRERVAKKQSVRGAFERIAALLAQRLQSEFECGFVATRAFEALRAALDAKDKFFPLPLKRVIGEFAANCELVLVVGGKQRRLSSKRGVVRMGRDCSNEVVLDDAKCSRSHARIRIGEDGKSAVFTDLGSHHGSYLNGKRVLQERLDDGDVLKIGATQITFRVKRKQNLIGKVFHKMF